MGKCFLRCTALEGAVPRRKDSLFDESVMHICVFLLTHATIHIITRNITHNVKRLKPYIHNNFILDAPYTQALALSSTEITEVDC